MHNVEFDDSFQILGRPGLFTESMKWKSLGWPNPSNDGDFRAPLAALATRRRDKFEARGTLSFEGIGTMAGRTQLKRGGSTSRAKKPPKSITINDTIGRIALAYSHDRTPDGSRACAC